MYRRKTLVSVCLGRRGSRRYFPCSAPPPSHAQDTATRSTETWNCANANWLDTSSKFGVLILKLLVLCATNLEVDHWPPSISSA